MRTGFSTAAEIILFRRKSADVQEDLERVNLRELAKTRPPVDQFAFVSDITGIGDLAKPAKSGTRVFAPCNSGPASHFGPLNCADFAMRVPSIEPAADKAADFQRSQIRTPALHILHNHSQSMRVHMAINAHSSYSSVLSPLGSSAPM